MRRLRLCLLTTPLLALAACGSSDVTVESSGSEESTGAQTESTGGEGGEVGSESEAGESEVGSESEAEAEAEATDATDTGTGVDDWARGISITRLEANQGAGVPVSIDGREATFDERYTRLPANRELWMFADVTVEAGWEAREIEARFTIVPADGDPIVASQILEITRSTSQWKADPDAGGDSIIEKRDFEGFSFGLPADFMKPGVEYSISLHEVDPAYLDAPLPETLPVLPPADASETSWPIGIETSNNVFRLVMVPIAMDFGGCQKTPAADDETIKRYVDHQFASNPVEEVDYEIHEPYAWNQSISDSGDLSAILSAMSQLKSSEGAGPEVYYYALIDNCGTCISGGGAGCIVGQARLPGDGMDSSDSLSRVGSGLLSTSTFVHELGHAQGRRHIFCEGAGAAGTDPDYPHDNGTLGSWGFDLRGLFLHSPNAGFDYMSYCGPSWVSNWQWEETYKRIATLSSWSDVVPPPSGPVLMMHIDDEGQSDTWVTQGWVDNTRAASGDRVHFFAGELDLGVAPARVTETAHGDGLQVAVELPTTGTPTRLEFEHAGQRKLVQLTNLSAG